MAKRNASKSNGELTTDNRNVMSMSEDEIQALLSQGATMAAEIVSLEQGQVIIGELVGRGPDIDYKDPSGDEKVLHTWRIEHDNGDVSALISKHQLEQQLPEMVGCRVLIQLVEMVDLGGKRVNRFRVANLTPDRKVTTEGN